MREPKHGLLKRPTVSFRRRLLTRTALSPRRKRRPFHVAGGWRDDPQPQACL